MDKQKLYNSIVDYLRAKGATKVAVFGSYVRNEETPESDIDILVDFNRQIGLMEFVRIERELSEFINIRVDLVMDGSINPLIQKYVDRDILFLNI
jgi:predicted nucleotidyltransferase